MEGTGRFSFAISNYSAVKMRKKSVVGCINIGSEKFNIYINGYLTMIVCYSSFLYIVVFLFSLFVLDKTCSRLNVLICLKRNLVPESARSTMVYATRLLYSPSKRYLCLCKCLVGFWKGYFNQKRCRRRDIFLIRLQKCPFCVRPLLK